MTQIELQIAMLTGAINLLAHESAWSRNHRAEDATGRGVDWMADYAVKWSVLGATMRIRGDMKKECNDSQSMSEIVGAFDDLYERLKKLVLTMYPERTRDSTFTITHFNQNPQTTFEDVVRVLELLRDELGGPAKMRFDHTTATVRV